MWWGRAVVGQGEEPFIPDMGNSFSKDPKARKEEHMVGDEVKEESRNRLFRPLCALLKTEER